jgi:hypothetical protein
MPKAKSHTSGSGSKGVDFDAELEAIESKDLKVGDHVSVRMGKHAVRKGKVTAVEHGDSTHSPMIQFETTNSVGEHVSYRHRPSLCVKD